MKLFEKRWFRLLLNGLCSVIILIIGIIFINVGLKGIEGMSKDNLTGCGYICVIPYSLISFVIYLLFDFRNYQNEDGVIKKGFTAIVYFLLWAVLVLIVFFCGMIGLYEIFEYSPIIDGKLNNLQFYTCFSLLSFGFSALFTQLILEKCSYAKHKVVEKRKKYAPFASFIGFVIAFVIFGVLGILVGNNEGLRQVLALVELLVPPIGFIIVCIKKFKERGEKKMLDKPGRDRPATEHPELWSWHEIEGNLESYINNKLCAGDDVSVNVSENKDLNSLNVSVTVRYGSRTRFEVNYYSTSQVKGWVNKFFRSYSTKYSKYSLSVTIEPGDVMV